MFNRPFPGTNYGFGQRAKQTLFVVILGPVLIIGAVLLTFWNERHALRVTNSLAEGAATVIEANAARVDPALEGRLVHLTRDLRPEGTLRDAEFGVKTSAVRLIRKVEMFQWIEKDQTDGRGSAATHHYSYVNEWRDQPVASNAFHDLPAHENPLRMRYPAATFDAALVRIGAYQVDPALLATLTDSEPLPLTAGEVQLPPGAQLTGNGQIYVGRDPNSPQVGDLRIMERVVPAGAASVVAAVKGGRLVAYHARAGGDIALLRPGSLDAATMFASAQASNYSLAWVLRGASLLGLFLGLQCILSPLARLASFVPGLGGLFESGVGIVSLLGSVVIWGVLVAVSWLAARPLLSVGLFLAAGLVAMLLVSRMFRRRAPQQTA